jgi:hypothetical protein
LTLIFVANLRLTQPHMLNSYFFFKYFFLSFPNLVKQAFSACCWLFLLVFGEQKIRQIVAVVFVEAIADLVGTRTMQEVES